MIYKTIHQIWDGKRTPPEWDQWIKSWTDNHPHWDYILWSADDCRNLIVEQFPWFLEMYDNYQFNIQRLDAIRYFILYNMGGLYCDLDIWCTKNIDSLITGDCVLFEGHPDHGLDEHFLANSIFTNSILYSSPRNKFMRCVQKSLKSGSAFIQHKDTAHPEGKLITQSGVSPGNPMTVAMTAGSGLLTRAYYRYRNITPVCVQSHERFEYHSKSERHNMLKHNNLEIPDISFGIHWSIGSWIVSEDSNLKYKFVDK
jgi:mannosyltransferase OCH1-like enzyme